VPQHRPALASRAAVVAVSTAAAALLATLPAAPADTTTAPIIPLSPAAPAAPAPPAPVVSLPFAPVANVSVRLDVSAAVAAASPAAVRTAAVQKALSKVGSPYRWGAAGPRAFDCSGLVNWAFRSAGKSVPRSSKALSRAGTPVSRSALQPGDLVFFYRGPSHVGIYIGNGKIVHASNRRSPVKVSDMSRMPFHSARRY
jgi:cell wall-associated NlpC family hydrolase